MDAPILASVSAGTVLGLSAGISPGPLLTLVISQTLKHGIREGTKVAMAPLLTDLPIVLLSICLIGTLRSADALLGAISLAGSFYIFFLAWESFTSKPPGMPQKSENPRSLIKGGIVNMLNPHPYLFWLTVGAPLLLKFYTQTSMAGIGFIAGFYFLLIGSKVGIAWAAGYTGGFLTGRGYLYLMRFLGCLLAVFALMFLWDALTLLDVWGKGTFVA